MTSRTTGLLLVLALATLASCATFPTKQLTLDLTGETVPIMLTKAVSSGKVKKLDFESGYSASSMSVSSTNNGVTTSMSMSDSRNENKPLAFQLTNTLVQEPRWIGVDRLELMNSYSLLLLVGSIEKTSYTMNLTIAIPVEGKK